MSSIPATQEADVGELKSSLCKVSQILFEKETKSKKTGGVAQMVDGLFA
jgi:hypothetical protein